MSGVTEQMIASARNTQADAPAADAADPGAPGQAQGSNPALGAAPSPNIATAREMAANSGDIKAAVDWVMRQEPGSYSLEEALAHVTGAAKDPA